MRFVIAVMIALSIQQSDLYAQQTESKVRIVFELTAPEVPGDAKVYLTGSLRSLGNWNPAVVQMKSLGEHLWTIEIESRAGVPIEYKYTLGSWSREGADKEGQPLKNFAITPYKDMTFKDTISHWTTGKPRKIKGQITGTVKYHRNLEFDGLLPRDVVVWLPPDYAASDRRYPVLYMHDGQNLFDPATSSFGVDWQIDETLTKLIAEGSARPVIVVGINNTAQRSQDYLPGKQGKIYAQLLREKIKPLIDRTYRTMTDADHTAIGGSSYGGVCAFWLAWEHSDLFSKSICMSPAFQYQNQDGGLKLDYVATFKSLPVPNKIPFFYIDNGGIGLEQILQPGIENMLQAMRDRGLKERQHFNWQLFPEARHDEDAWSRRMPDALKQLFPSGKSSAN